jgi:hypothetical protein
MNYWRQELADALIGDNALDVPDESLRFALEYLSAGTDWGRANVLAKELDRVHRHDWAAVAETVTIGAIDGEVA